MEDACATFRKPVKDTIENQAEDCRIAVMTRGEGRHLGLKIVQFDPPQRQRPRQFVDLDAQRGIFVGTRRVDRMRPHETQRQILYLALHAGPGRVGIVCRVAGGSGGG